LTVDPRAGTKILEAHPEREQLDALSDREVLRRSARELCISTILVSDEFQECASTLVAENPAEVAQLLKALCGALPAAVAAFGEVLNSWEHPRPQRRDDLSLARTLAFMRAKNVWQNIKYANSLLCEEFGR
jgi:hypothetical protein